MNEYKANCPRCGKPVEFHGDFAMSSICEACGAIVVRPDYGQPMTGESGLTRASPPRMSGSIEPPTREDSPLEFGMRGRYQGHDFDIRGVVRLRHDEGGFWDEWYLLFDDGRCGWLAEVQQRLYLTFPVELKGAAKIPEFNELNIEQRFLLRTGEPPMKVAEKGAGRPIGARGEIPYELKPQADYRYADLSGPGGRFATIDYGDSPPTVYFGQEVHLADLHLPHRHEDVSHDPRHVDSVETECPHCRGRLTLFAPHKTVRVGCTHCGAILDADDGRLQQVRLAAHPPTLRLPIGSKGQLNAVQYTVVGYMKRCLMSDATATWDEYLLYNPQVGFRWLTCGDDHWNFVETVPPGDVEATGGTARYAGKTFNWEEQDVTSTVAMLGEFYWKAGSGEKVWTTDFVRPPEILSREITHGGPDSGEVSWSHGTYVAVEAVERAFGLAHTLPRPRVASPNQPSPVTRLYAWWAVMAGLTLLMGIVFAIRGRNDQIMLMQCDLPAVVPGAGSTGGGDFGPVGSKPDAPASGNGTPRTSASGINVSGGTGSLATSESGSTGGDEGKIFFSDPFQVRAHENVEMQVSATATNFWLGVDGDLVDEQTGVVQEFSVPVEYYQGVEDGEAWTEGSRTATIYLAAMPAGKYLLRVVGQQEPRNTPIHFTVRVRQNVPRIEHLLLALAGVSILPAVVLIVRLYRKAQGRA
jgi:ribosomal protein S27E